VAFGYLAGITQRIELTTGVLILPQRQTVLVAKQASEVDLLSGERLRLGVGTGWNYVEYDALGQDFKSRGKRMDEQIEFRRASPATSIDPDLDRRLLGARIPTRWQAR
jgi:alkanesulfonate monooxygenase SsuD/methylene tetrahydromethanopterin reductase-like flavin-dependent oxidoreductase (luciferase family)